VGLIAGPSRRWRHIEVSKPFQLLLHNGSPALPADVIIVRHCWALVKSLK
jgi:hypothetical protein